MSSSVVPVVGNVPDRIIRDELLTSERYWSVSIQAQQLYVHLLLVVDDAARFSGKNFTLRASCFPGKPIEANELERMLTELTDADLVRAYFLGSERFIFVPRFRNRRRYVGTSKYPTPPNEINDLPSEKADLSQPKDIPKSGGVGVGEGLERVNTRASAAALEPAALMADGLTEQTAVEWLAHRKRKRAPLTQRAWDGIKREAGKAGWQLEDAICKALERGWQSFDAAFVAKEPRPASTVGDV